MLELCEKSTVILVEKMNESSRTEVEYARNSSPNQRNGQEARTDERIGSISTFF